MSVGLKPIEIRKLEKHNKIRVIHYHIKKCEGVFDARDQSVLDNAKIFKCEEFDDMNAAHEYYTERSKLMKLHKNIPKEKWNTHLLVVKQRSGYITHISKY